MDNAALTVMSRSNAFPFSLLFRTTLADFSNIIHVSLQFCFILCIICNIVSTIRSWCGGSSDRSFMVDPWGYFSFQPVLHDWCNKGMCYSVCRLMHIKEHSLLIGKSSPCDGNGFPLSLSEWSFTIIMSDAI